MKRFLKLVVLVPVAIILIVLSVANRQTVTLALNPFNPADSVLAVAAPFFIFLFLAVILGMIIGSFATWVGQGKYRKRARNEASEAVKWYEEAEKHKTRAETIASQTLLPASPK